VAKKRTAPKKKTAGKAKGTAKGKAKGKVKAAGRPPRGDVSRIDTSPLQEHIKRRIRELETARPMAAAPGGAEDETLERLRQALETLEDICHPTMTIPI
jgi:hypothetical protein